MHEERDHIEDKFYRLWTGIIGIEDHLDDFENHGEKAWNHIRLTLFVMRYEYYTLSSKRS